MSDKQAQLHMYVHVGVYFELIIAKGITESCTVGDRLYWPVAGERRHISNAVHSVRVHIYGWLIRERRQYKLAQYNSVTRRYIEVYTHTRIYIHTCKLYNVY